ncbi:MAG: molybdopterin molybdotransferase MoeA [Rectinemataceae bacterium]|jgi:molybdopterin molybdotransferase
MSVKIGDGRTALGLDEALRIVVEAAPPPVFEKLSLGDALGRVLANTARAKVDQPPFDKSAMDGFAHGSPLPAPGGPWRVAGLAAARAGGVPSPLKPGECLRIMTGAMIPPGTVAVQRVERTETLPHSPGSPELVRFTRAEEWDNVIRRGENQKEGDILLTPRVLRPQDIGILASSGYEDIVVAKRPRVAVVSTGDELVATGSLLSPGAIFDSNGPQLTAQAQACGCDARFVGIVLDDEDALALAFEEALADCNVLIVSGGVSMGDFDHVPRALARAGVEKLFHGLAMRPGKPVFFGTRRAGTCAFGRADASAFGRADASAFGLAGNPVSTFVGFEVLVRPHLAARVGLDWHPRFVGARLASTLERRETDRLEFLPARLESGTDGLPALRPLSYKGSSMLSALADADCLVSMEIGVGRLETGSVVNARLVRP